MEKLTYQEAYDKIITAYFKNEIKPMNSEFCFCGTLHGGRGWRAGDELYSGAEYWGMEDPLIKGLSGHYHSEVDLKGVSYEMDDTPEAEEILFKNMCKSLEVLKEIHRSRGEDVDTYVPEKQFIKRELVKN